MNHLLSKVWIMFLGLGGLSFQVYADDIAIVPVSGHTSSGEGSVGSHVEGSGVSAGYGESTATENPNFPGTTKVFVYLRCNSTSWDLTDGNRLLPFKDGFAFVNEITEQWMVEFTEACVFTVTDELNKWTPRTREFVAKEARPFAKDSQSYGIQFTSDAGKNVFRMKYGALGSYIFFLNLDVGYFTVMPNI